MTLENFKAPDTKSLDFDQIHALGDKKTHQFNQMKLTSTAVRLPDKMEESFNNSDENILNNIEDILDSNSEDSSIEENVGVKNKIHNQKYGVTSNDMQREATDLDEKDEENINEFDLKEIDDIEKFNPDPRKLIQIRQHIEELTERLTLIRKKHKNVDNRKMRKQISSRISQLRKNAAYQENKIKLRGLILERDRLHYYIDKTKRFLTRNDVSNDERKYLVEKINMTLNDRIAGNFDVFIGSVIHQTMANKEKRSSNK